MREIQQQGVGPVAEDELGKVRLIAARFPAYGVLPIEVAADLLPEPHGGILRRREHLTQMLEDRNGGPLQLKVLESQREGSIYSRVITKAGQGRILEFALITINLELCPPTVAAEIVAEKVPVGRILIDSGVPREVFVLGFCEVHLAPGNCIFAVDRPTKTYGRYTVIALNGVRAIYVLEILAPELP